MGRRLPLVALLGAFGISHAGSVMTLLAIPWFVFQTTGSGVQTGVVTAAETVGLLASSILSGPVIDRVGARGISVLADIAAVIAVGTIPLADATVGLSLPLLTVLAGLAGLTRAPGDTAKRVLLPGAIALARTTLERGSGAADAMIRLGRTLGAPLAGTMIMVIGAPGVLLLDAATFLVAALLIGVCVRVDEAVLTESGGYFGWLATGLRYVRRDRLILAIIGTVTMMNALDAGLNAVLQPAFAATVRGSSVLLGELMGVFGLGAAAGSVIYGWLGSRWSRWPTFAVCALLAGAPRFLLLWMEPSVPLLLFGFFICGLAAGSLNPVLVTVELDRIPAHLRARVLGAGEAGVLAMMPVGALVAGVLLDGIGLEATLLAFAAVYAVTTLCPVAFRVWRQMDERPIPAPAPQPVAV
ncbi:MFS transporter [Kibdelosporangium persicum]|uniref:Transmembrane secretion effector n=1 Tax=Kibdelosporangium persicum TaxID=2698649 RepID=A0ABX2F823_9PSEU|nr:MFS transporter [Kibdelosporangium persicum]NRN67509.1 Transmembrane secretion effector [Kibdelosporangium persicum]